MNYNPQDELISAYLDGELSPDERRRVERLLAENVELRQLHDELLAVRGSLAQLPRFQLPHDLSARVLRRAEQTLVGDSEQVAADEAAIRSKSATEASRPDAAQLLWPDAAEPLWSDGADKRVRLADAAASHHTPWRPRLTWRAVVWPVLVVAAAVFMMINSRNPAADKPREIARVDKTPAPRGGNASIGAAPSEDDRDQVGLKRAELAGSEEQSEELKKNADNRGVADGREAVLRSKDRGASGEQFVPNRGIAPDGAQANGAAPGAAPLQAQGRAAAKGDAPAADSIAGRRNPAAVARDKEAEAKPATDAAGARAAGGLAGNRQPEFGRQQRERTSNDKVGNALSADRPVDGEVGTPAGGALVVEVQLTPEAVRSGALEQLLARHDLVLSSAGDDNTHAVPEQAAGLSAMSRQSAAQPLDQAKSVQVPANAPPAAAPATTSPLPAVGGQAKAERAADPQFVTAHAEKNAAVPAAQVVTIDATSAQVAATLQDLQAHPDQFASVLLSRSVALEPRAESGSAEFDVPQLHEHLGQGKSRSQADAQTDVADAPAAVGAAQKAPSDAARSAGEAAAKPAAGAESKQAGSDPLAAPSGNADEAEAASADLANRERLGSVPAPRVPAPRVPAPSVPAPNAAHLDDAVLEKTESDKTASQDRSADDSPSRPNVAPRSLAKRKQKQQSTHDSKRQLGQQKKAEARMPEKAAAEEGAPAQDAAAGGEVGAPAPQTYSARPKQQHDVADVAKGQLGSEPDARGLQFRSNQRGGATLKLSPAQGNSVAGSPAAGFGAQSAPGSAVSPGGGGGRTSTVRGALAPNAPAARPSAAGPPPASAPAGGDAAADPAADEPAAGKPAAGAAGAGAPEQPGVAFGAAQPMAVTRQMSVPSTMHVRMIFRVRAADSSSSPMPVAPLPAEPVPADD